MTLPTQLSLLRILLTFIIIGLLFLPGPMPKAAALSGFLLASLTDWLDGYLARRLGQASAFGAIIDPIADKVLTLGLFGMFVWLQLMPLWMAAVIAVREIVITGVRLVALRRRVVLAAASEGKQKMVSQVVCIIVLLAICWLRAWPGHTRLSADVLAAIDATAAVFRWITVGLTAFSGLLFFYRHRAVLRRMVAPSA